MKTTIILKTAQQKRRAQEVIGALALDGPIIWEVVVRPYKTSRNLEQNAKMWATLAEISDQVVWHGQKLTPENWKDVFTAALKRLKVVPGVDGGFVVIGAHTSKMTIAEMSEMIEFAVAFGTQHNVRWSYPK